jgi:hypothetical protein
MKDFIKLIITLSLHSTLESCGATPVDTSIPRMTRSRLVDAARPVR